MKVEKGDRLTDGGWFGSGWFAKKATVIDIFNDYAYVCKDNDDELYIMNCRYNGVLKPGTLTSTFEGFTCSEYLRGRLTHNDIWG